MVWNFKIQGTLSGVLVSILFISLIWGIGYVVSHRQNAVEKRYGFCAMTPSLQWHPCLIEPIMIRCVEKDGVFDKAGFNDKDIITSPAYNSVSTFFKSLKLPKGSVVVFEVIPYNDFKPVCEPDKRGKPVKRIVIVP